MKIQVRLGMGLALSVVLCWLGYSQRKGEPSFRGLGDLTGPSQLFVDDYLIEAKANLTRTYHAFQKHPANPLPGGDRLASRSTVLPMAKGGYQAWGRGNYFTSADGFSWNNSTPLTYSDITRTAKRQAIGSVIHTPWDLERPFKTVTYDYTLWQKLSLDPVEKGGARYGAYSADGQNWVDLPDPLFSDRTDTGEFNWDPHEKRYFGTPKVFSYILGYSRRCVGFSASEKFQADWPSAVLMLAPDLLDDRWVTKPGQRTEFYSLSAFAYESMYLGYLEVFRNTDGWKDGNIFIELVTSRDGFRWKRQEGDRTPLIPLGPAGAWDSGMIKVPNHPIIEGDLVKLFYRAGDYTHAVGRKEYASFSQTEEKQGGLGLATLRKDGFVSFDADQQVGSLTTKPLRNTRGPLIVNFLTRPQGWLKVEVLGNDGKVLPGYSEKDSVVLSGDQVRQSVSWGSIKELPDQSGPIRLRFLLQRGSLFSFRAGDSLQVESEVPSLAVLYTFEGDHGRQITDRLDTDGIQRAYLQNAVVVDDDKTQKAIESPSAFGKSSLMFLAGASQEGQFLRAQSLYAGAALTTELYQGEGAALRDTVEIENTYILGSQFTLAAMVQSVENDHTRLFSTWEPYPVRVNEAPYERTAQVGKKELIFDFDPSGRSEFGCMRLVVQGQTVSAPCSFADGKYHHLAATYKDGDVRLYLDGKELTQKKILGGPVTLLTNLRIGEDPGPFTNNSKGPTSDEQLKGAIDDLLVLGRTLPAEHIRILSKEGAEALFFSGRGLSPAN